MSTTDGNNEGTHLHLKLDLGEMDASLFQSDLHFVEEDSEDLPQRINSLRIFTRVSYRPNIWDVLPSSGAGNSRGEDISEISTTVTFTSNPLYHFLSSIYLRTEIPHIEVKEHARNNVEICWPHNIGHNIITIGQLCFDNIPHETVTSEWLDANMQWFEQSGAGKRETRQVAIGSTEILEEWSSVLPAFPLNVPQPFSHTRHPSMAIPQLLNSSMSRVSYNYRFNLEVTSHLKMRVCEERVIDDHTGEDKTNWIYPLEGANIDYLACSDRNWRIKTPTMWGKYSQVTEEEKENFWCNGESFDYVYYDIQKIVSETCTFGMKPQISIDSACLVNNIFVMARSEEAVSLRNRSNYTTDPHSCHRGWMPIKSMTVRINNQPRIGPLGYDQISRMSGLYDYISAPFEQGYGAVSFGTNRGNFSNRTDTGFYLARETKCSIHFTIGDSNPYTQRIIMSRDHRRKVGDNDNFIPTEVFSSRSGGSVSSVKDIDDGNKYRIIILMMTTKKVTFSPDMKIRILDGTEHDTIRD